MFKNQILMLLMIILISTGAFAQNKSAGFGINIAASFDSYKFDGEDWGKERVIVGGISAFYEVTFVEASIGLMFGNMREVNVGDFGGNVLYGTLGLFGKYPFSLGMFTLFPMTGIQSDLGVIAYYKVIDGDRDNPERGDFLNRLWIKSGIGVDNNCSDNVFYRFTFLYGINFGNTDDWVFKRKTNNFNSFHHGLDFRIAIGFKF